MPAPASPLSPKMSSAASIGCFVGLVPSGSLAELITASLPRAIQRKCAVFPEACSTAPRTCAVSSKVLEVAPSLWRPESRSAGKCQSDLLLQTLRAFLLSVTKNGNIRREFPSQTQAGTVLKGQTKNRLDLNRSLCRNASSKERATVRAACARSTGLWSM